MTKQHFEAFAREIANSNRPTNERAAAAWVVVRVAQQFNSRFDVSRFFKAAGLPQLAGGE
jgi:hypothetical protein